MTTSLPARLVLLGDSVFDNAKYVAPGASVPELLQQRLGSGWLVENRAMDGNMVELLIDPAELAHSGYDPARDVVLSVGGNDAIYNVDLLADPVPRAAVESVRRLQVAAGRFAAQYDALVESIVQGISLRLIGCTIYQPLLEEFPRDATAGALAIFNDAIIRSLHRRRLDWIDLRDVCFLPEHFTNVVEPSEEGGGRIAEAIARSIALDSATGID